LRHVLGVAGAMRALLLWLALTLGAVCAFDSICTTQFLAAALDDYSNLFRISHRDENRSIYMKE
jgi:hypothetical protein